LRQTEEPIRVEFIIEKSNGMKKVLILFLATVLSIACVQKQEKHFKRILSSLTKNYTIQGGFDSFTQICWKVSYKDFVKDSIEYKNYVDEFYKQDMEFLIYLIQFKDDVKSSNNWIKKRNPCNSKVGKNDFINNSKGALILIDNLLVNDNQKSIIYNDYVDNMEFEDVEQIIKNENNVEEVKNKYLKYIAPLK